MPSVPLLPSCPEARPVTVDDRPWLSRLLLEMRPEMSELSFGNLYLFRRAHQYQLTAIDGAPVIVGKGYDGLPYALPPLGERRRDAFHKLLAAGMTLYADRNVAAELGECGDWTVTPVRDDADYLYRRSDLSDLPGNRYHRKRNRISYFVSRHSFSVEPFSARYRTGALELLDEWGRAHNDDGSPSFRHECEAAREAVEMFELLGLTGIVVLVADKVFGFALGELLNDDTVVCHFEKGDPFADGIFQLVNREFARFLPPQVAFVNREQDLGDPGLRQAKLSYLPVRLVEKVRIRHN